MYLFVCHPELERERTNLPIAGSPPSDCNDQGRARKLKLDPGLPHDWQGPKDLDHVLLMLRNTSR